MADYRNEYLRWLNSSFIDAGTRKELESIKGNEKEQEERFYTELNFGTAGIRGIIGAGTNRMNIYVVRRAAAGLAEYLLKTPDGKERGTAIAYDSRNFSKEFAHETACVLAFYGIKVYLYSTLHSVPQLSFAVRELHTKAGVVITASHNPPEYNGFKVYWETGGQCGPKQADEILSCIKKIDYFDVRTADYDTAVKQGLIKLIGKEIDEIYYKKTQSLMLNAETVRLHGADINIVYTPLHGSGCVPVSEMLRRIGASNVFIVPEQKEPDGNFPTVKAPNPEDPNTFTLAIQLADKVNSDLIIATDPDSDRLGVAVRGRDGRFRMLTGNQIGSILTYYLLSEMKAKGTLPENGFVAKSLVSTRLADVICRKFGVEMKEVLTGFRFIAEQIDIAEESKKSRFIFGFEESYGSLAGGFAHDKDAICAAMLVCEAAIVFKQRGLTLYDLLERIFDEFGYFAEKTKAYTLTGKAGIEKIASAMRALRQEPIKVFADEKVKLYEDFLLGRRVDYVNNAQSATTLPKSDVLRFLFDDEGWAVIRPSGTEPKLKFYAGVRGKTRQEADEKLEKLLCAADEIISDLLR